MDAIRFLLSLGVFTEYHSSLTQESLILGLSRSAYSFTQLDSVAFDATLLKEVLDRRSSELVNKQIIMALLHCITWC
jgi:hypothetical protein